MPLRTFATVVSGFICPRAKFWWFADCIQYDNQLSFKKKAPPILFEGIHAAPILLFQKMRGMNEGLPVNFAARRPQGFPPVETMQLKPGSFTAEVAFCPVDGDSLKEIFSVPWRRQGEMEISTMAACVLSSGHSGEKLVARHVFIDNF